MAKNRNSWMIVRTANGRKWMKIQQPPQQQQPAVQSGTGSPPSDPTQLDAWFQNATDADVDAFVSTINSTPVDDAQQDTGVQRFFNYIGWSSNTPTVLTESSWQKQWAADGSPTRIYHADAPAGGSDSKQFAQQFFGNRTDASGNTQRQFASAGMHGDGAYFSPTACVSSDYGDNMFRGYFNSNARVISASAARNGA